LESGNTFLNKTYSAYQPLEGSSNLSNKYLFTFFGWPKWTLNYMDRLGAMEFLSQINDLLYETNSFKGLESGNTFLNKTYSAYQYESRLLLLPLEGSSNLSNKYLFTFFGWPKWTLNYMDRLGAMEFLSQI
ncbi:hypothetical protein ACJX0J_020222, partial [Zea mays]